MMTSKRFILVSLLCALSRVAIACGPFYYPASTSDIYRIMPYGLEGPSVAARPDFGQQNVMLWSRQTGCNDTASIRQAIYQGTLADWESLFEASLAGLWVTDTDDRFWSNPFVCQLQKQHDADAIRILYWSKVYECIRNAQRSPWYYNSRVDTDEKRQLRSLYDGLQHHRPSAKYGDRYRFLTVKCAWALGEDNSVAALWKAWGPKMKGSILHAETEDYYARSLYRMGRVEEAVRIYMRHQDVESLMKIQDCTLPELLAVLLRYAPDSQLLAIELQRMLFSLENNPYVLGNRTCISGYEDDAAILLIARRAEQTTIIARRAMWSYTAACLLDYQGRPLEALHQLDGVDTLPCDAFLKNSIRVLRFYLHVKTDSISDDFERYAIDELRWMDDNLRREWSRMPLTERFRLSHLTDVSPVSMYRSCYMYDAMRRILLPDTAGLCWRMAADGRQVRALQLANMAENRFFQIADNPIMKAIRRGDTIEDYTCFYDFDRDGFTNNWYCWWAPDTSQACPYPIRWNSHDYRNWMFLLADRMEARTLEAYRQRMLHPQDDTDRWLNARGYTDGDYWQDIVGTHYLRECNYQAAAAHLKFVSSTYQKRMNVWFAHDAFAIDRGIANTDTVAYKYHFACRMADLQWQMRSGSSDSRALAMLEYAIGMRNSFNLCWYLTTYGRTAYEYLDDDDWLTYDPVRILSIQSYPYLKRYTLRADLLQRRAFTLLRSDEAKAQAYARIGNNTKVMTSWPATATGQRIAHACDEWRHYRLSSLRQPAVSRR